VVSAWPQSTEKREEKNLSGNLIYIAIPVVIVGYLIYRNFAKESKAMDNLAETMESREQEHEEKSIKIDDEVRIKREEKARKTNELMAQVKSISESGAKLLIQGQYRESILEFEKFGQALDQLEMGRLGDYDEWNTLSDFDKVLFLNDLKPNIIQASNDEEKAIKLFAEQNSEQFSALESTHKKIDQTQDALSALYQKCGALGMSGYVRAIDGKVITVFGNAIPWTVINESQSQWQIEAENVPGAILDERTLIIKGYSEDHKGEGILAIGNHISVGPFCYETKKPAINAFGGPTTAYIYGRCACESKAESMEANLSHLEEEKENQLSALGISEGIFEKILELK
jgi:hypothetical protein